MRSLPLSRLAAVLLIVILVAGATSTAQVANAHPTTGRDTDINITRKPGAQGKTLVDLGFRPDKDGFGFENYAGRTAVTDLTPADLRRLFGEQVCANLDGDICTLIPPAQQFMDQMNKFIGGGRCEGMAVLSMLFYTGQEKPDDFGGANTVTLPFKGNEALQREIAYWWTTQITSPARAQKLTGVPIAIIKTLYQSMQDKKENYVLDIYHPGYKNGHAVTPYAIQDMGNSKFHVMVYDNNWPKAERFIEFDTKANTWKYIASINPDVPAAVYEGDATSPNMLMAPISPRIPQQDCTFCAQKATSYKIPGLAATAQRYNEVSLYTDSEVTDADLLITDAQGHKLGYSGGKFYNEIPNADFQAMASGDLYSDDPEPVYFVPVGVAFTVTLDGSALKKDEITNVSMLGPGYDLAVEHITLKAGEKDTIIFSPDGSKISYTPSGEEAPTIVVGLQHAGPDYEFEIVGADVQAGASINVTLDLAQGRLGVNTTGKDEKPTTYALHVDRLGEKSNDLFSHDGLSINPGETAYIEFGAWDGKGDMTVSIDKEGDGKVDSSAPVPNSKK